MTHPQVARQQVVVRFADLRRLAATVPPYLAEKVGVKEMPTLGTAIEDDFGIGGLDTESLVLEFGADYRVELAEFDFTGLINAEPGVVEYLLFFPIGLLLLACWLGKTLVALLVWPCSPWRAEQIWARPALSFWLPFWFPVAKRPIQEVLTVGDFVASAALGRFVKRERVRFVVAGPNLANNQQATA